MEFADAERFMQRYHRGVVTTYRRNGAAQMSILASGPFRDTAAFVVAGRTAKLANLKRDPRCTVLTVTDDWGQFVVVEGRAELHTWDNTDHEQLRLLLRDVYKAAGGDHPNYEEYDRVMRQDRRAVVMVHPEHVYGMFR